jgi:hypothetical protein
MARKIRSSPCTFVPLPPIGESGILGGIGDPYEKKVAMPAPLNLLCGVKAITRYLYGEVTAENERRVRHLIRVGDLPSLKIRGKIESRPEWLDAIYAEPDRPGNSR